MSNTPSKAEIEALVKRHGATSYRNRADTQHPAYGFTEDGLNGLIDEVLAKWGTPKQEVQEPCGWTTGITWRPNTRLQSEQVIKITRDTQPKYGYTTPIYTAPQQQAPDCHHRPPCDECAAIAAKGGKT